MLQRILKLNNFVHQSGFYKGISSVKSLYKDTPTTGKSEDEEDISEDVLLITRKLEPKKKNEYYDTKKTLDYMVSTNTIYRLRHFLKCTDEEAYQITKVHPQVEQLKKKNLSKALDFLLHHGITLKSIVENPFLLTMEEYVFNDKMEIAKGFIDKSYPEGDINDVVPLLELSTLVLTRALFLHKNDEDMVPFGSRIFYMSKELNVPPSTVSKYFASRIFIFAIPFENIAESLKILKQYEINPKSILRDLWVFKYDPQQMKDRFAMCKATGRENLRPWMVRCRLETLMRSNKIYIDEKKILADSTLIQYLAKRLKCDEATINVIVHKDKQISRTRAVKIKEVLDYFLDELKYEPIEIMHSIRIIAHSLDTTKKRMAALAAVGCRPINVQILCRSKAYFNKFVQDWSDKKESKI